MQGETMKVDSAIIDDLSRDPPLSAIGTRWQLFTDRVMGGVSNGTMVREMVAGRPAIRMRGDVSLENNGGFIQIALDLAADGKAIDASAWRGIELDVFGNEEEYNIHLRTEGLWVGLAATISRSTIVGPPTPAAFELRRPSSLRRSPNSS